MKLSFADYFRGVDKVKGIKTFVLIVLMAIFEVAGIASIMPFIGFLANPEVFLESIFMAVFFDIFSFDKNNFYSSIALSIGLFSLSVLTITLLIRSFTTYKLNIFIEETRHAMSTNLMKEYLGVNYKYITNNNSSKFTKAILSEVDQFIGQVFRPIILMLAYIVVAISVISFLLIYNWKITLTIVIVFSISYFVVYKFLKNILNKLGEQVVQTNEARFSTASEVTSGIKAIKIFQSEEVFKNRFFKASLDFSKAQAGKQSITLIPNDFIEFLVFGGSIAGVLLYIFYFTPVESGAISEIFAPLTIFALAAYRLKPALFNIFIGLSSFRFGDAIVRSLKNLKKELQHNQAIKQKPKKHTKFKKLNISNLTFRYAKNLEPVLKDQDLEIRLGEFIGIIGPSGSGKSTLVDILTGLLEPETGFKSIDDLIIKNNDNSWQGLFGYVPQDIFILDDNFYTNVAFGEQNIDKHKVIEACKQAKLHEFIINNHDSGYDANLGERGMKISGGQKQRLGIARALYFKPKVLILDEGTSALDQKIEDEILSSLEALKGKISIIMITHRPSTLKICDKVIELKDGCLNKISES